MGLFAATGTGMSLSPSMRHHRSRGESSPGVPLEVVWAMIDVESLFHWSISMFIVAWASIPVKTGSGNF